MKTIVLALDFVAASVLGCAALYSSFAPATGGLAAAPSNCKGGICPVCKCDPTDARECAKGECLANLEKQIADLGASLKASEAKATGLESKLAETFKASPTPQENFATAHLPPVPDGGDFRQPVVKDCLTTHPPAKPVMDNSGPPARTQPVQPAVKPLVWISTGRRRGYWAVPSGQSQTVSCSSGGCAGGNSKGR